MRSTPTSTASAAKTSNYIRDAFPIVKRKDVERYGTYRTKEMILSHYDRYAGMGINAPEQG